MSAPRLAVIGAGAWGTTLALRLATAGPVHLLARDEATARAISGVRENRRHLPGFVLPAEVSVGADPAALASADQLVVVAVPSAAMRTEATRWGTSVHPAAVVLSAAKGLEQGSLLRMTEVLAEQIPAAQGRIAALSGPNLALEIAQGLPASSVVAAADEAVGPRVVDLLASRTLRLYTNRDVIGVELCGALKNIIAIAAGAADGLGFGDNGKASLITRGLAEMTRLGLAAGANPLTFGGLAGVGDVLATCGSGLSRNHRLGVELAKGGRWADIEGALPGVAEGAYTVDAALEMAARLGVEMPIAQEVHNALFEGKSVQRCLADLLGRESKEELAGLDEWVRRRLSDAVRART
ncbi:MAG: NAD(P)H-dependent glycerol-3-phosphate dehydrogenase [Candidatus Limnocylindrales bacterium]